jgi:hypothetical protein
MATKALALAKKRSTLQGYPNWAANQPPDGASDNPPPGDVVLPPD